VEVLLENLLAYGRVEDDGIIEIKSVIIPVHYYNIKRVRKI